MKAAVVDLRAAQTQRKIRSELKMQCVPRRSEPPGLQSHVPAHTLQSVIHSTSYKHLDTGEVCVAASASLPFAKLGAD